MIKTILFLSLAVMASSAAPTVGVAADLGAAPPDALAACRAQWRDMVAARTTAGVSVHRFMHKCLARQDDSFSASASQAHTAALAAAGSAAVVGIAVAASQSSSPASP